MQDSVPYLKPGLHSHNVLRRGPRVRPRASVLGSLRVLLFAAGFLCLGYFVYTWADQNIYQSYENWAFDQQREGKVAAQAMPLPATGSVLGRVQISRLNISAMVRQGVDDQTLKEAVGHVPSTALAGNLGNFALAAHRDTLFRGLKDIRIGDTITFQTPSKEFHYQVAATKIVKPSDVSILRPDGGGLVKTQAGAAPPQMLTMITCYPFYYIGAAPERFIVQATLQDDTAGRLPAP